MQNWTPNPYFNLTAIRKPDMFFGRINLLRRFYAAIANHQSVALVGSQHIGKSSLLRCASLPEVQAQFADFKLYRHIFIYLDLREYLRKTREDFFHTVCRGIIAQSRGLADLKLRPAGKGENKYSLLLEQIVDQDYFPVLLLDAFDNVTLNEYFDPNFFRFLRSQATIGKVSYVTATLAPLAEVCHSGIVDSPFFNIFYNYTIGPLTLEEAQNLILKPTAKAGLPCTEEEKTWILHKAGRHPFFIQRVCHHFFEEKLSQGSGQINLLHVEKLAYEDLQPHFQDTWDHLSKKHLTVLQNEAKQQEKSDRELPELSESDLFRQFVRNTCRTKVFNMSAEELEKALDKIDNAGALGETNLQLMNLVAQRLKSDTSPSATEKGMAIRAILNEALERLRGPVARTDSDPALQNYNILYYRFFKYHLKNEQIAARISISVRQYFRYRTQAIHALLDILITMEDASLRDA
ncbi:MAG: hypothetical protein ACHQT8_07400 [Chlamydiales bacterium]